MRSIIVIGRLILFFISGVGYWEFFRNKSKISVYFLPGFTVAFQISVLFVAGILNCLKPAYILLFVFGLILAIYFLFKEKIQFPAAYLNEGFVFLFCAICLCGIALKGKIFASYDTFSHWALVVKSMLATNRFPNYEDILIGFKAYPLGSSSYIYYFAKIISTSESVQMLAQAYMMLCFILPIFKYGRKLRISDRVFNVAFLTVFTNLIFYYIEGISRLLVDTLLPLEGMASVLFIFSECIKRDEEGEKVSFLYAIPFLCAAIQIKNSGIFFVLLACVVIIAAVFRYKMDWRGGAVACISPFVSLYLWQAHYTYVFSGALTSKHAMSISNYIYIFSLKTSEDISVIADEIIAQIFQGKELYVLVALLLVLTIITVIFARRESKKLIEVWVVCVSVYAVYMLGMFFMYLFSMPGQEATSLSSFARYRKTILVALYYIIIWFFISLPPQIEYSKKRWIAALAAALALIVTWKYELGSFITIFTPTEGATERERLWIENVAKEYGVQQQKSYFICVPGNLVGYTGYLCQYIFWSNQLAYREITEENQLDDATEYDYIILYDKNDIVKEWVSKNFPEQVGQDVIIVGEGVGS